MDLGDHPAETAAFPSSIFADLVEGQTKKIVVQDAEGNFNESVTETHRITATEGRVRRPNRGAIRKTRWRELSETRVHENQQRKELNRISRLVETPEETAARRLR